MMKSLVAVAVLLTSILPTGRAQARTPQIEHVVVVLLQNATFDHMFGAYPGADGLDPRRDRLRDARGHIQVPLPLSTEDFGRRGTFPLRFGEEALSNGAPTALEAFNQGRMDGFLTAQEHRGKLAGLAMRHHTRGTMPALWHLADEYVLFDRFFSARLSDSIANNLLLADGDDQGIVQGTKSVLASLWKSDFSTIFDRAESAGTSWRYYLGNLGRLNEERLVRGDYFTPRLSSTPLYWAPMLSIERFWKPGLKGGIKDQADFFQDAALGELPSVSYVLPSPNTHWPALPFQSQARLASVVNAVRKSPAWERSAIFVIWDDWGGFYDHVRPPRSGGERLGFRVPALLISPLVKRGYVSSVRHDHTSIPAFIAETFGWGSARDARVARSFDDVWVDRPHRDDPLLTIGEPTRYEASGQGHAESVFRLYLLGLGWAAAALSVGALVASRRRRWRETGFETSSRDPR